MAPRKSPPANAAYSTLDRFGDMTHVYSPSGGDGHLGVMRSGCGAYWPDFGPTAGDSNMAKGQPSSYLFDRPAKKEDRPTSPRRQFRHPSPATEALWSSTMVMPYKSGGRKKCSEGDLWQSSKHQAHPLNRASEHNIAATCKLNNLAAGSACTTSALEAVMRTNNSAPSLGFSAKVPDATSTISRLHGTGASQGTLSLQAVRKSLFGSLRGPSGPADDGDSCRELPKWIASRTLATRDTDAAGLAACRLPRTQPGRSMLSRSTSGSSTPVSPASRT